MVQSRRKIDSSKITKVAETLKTISHPVRIEILSVLEANGALTVTEIQEQVDIAVEQSLLSHHLIKMKDKGLLQSEKRGMNVFYRLSDPNIMRIFDCLDGCRVF